MGKTASSKDARPEKKRGDRGRIPIESRSRALHWLLEM
jgi:hypothetical protein